MTIACMGGFCAVRDNCRHYGVEGAQRQHPLERLCDPGTSSDFSPIRSITFRAQLPGSSRANSVFDLARAQQAGVA